MICMYNQKNMYCIDICVLRYVSCIFRPTSNIKSMYMQTCFPCMLHTITCRLNIIQLVSQNNRNDPFTCQVWFSVGRKVKHRDFLTVLFFRCFLVSLKSFGKLKSLQNFRKRLMHIDAPFSVFDSWILSSSWDPYHL